MKLTRNDLLNSQILVWDIIDKEYLYSILSKLGIHKRYVGSTYNSGIFIIVEKGFYRRIGERLPFSAKDDVATYETNTLCQSKTFYVYEKGKLIKNEISTFDVERLIKYRGKIDDTWFRKVIYKAFNQEDNTVEKLKPIDLEAELLVAPSVNN